MERQIAGTTDAIVWLYALICVCSESESNGSGLALANRDILKLSIVNYMKRKSEITVQIVGKISIVQFDCLL